MSRLRDRASAVLRANDRGTHTVPARDLYPHQWAWDSAFIAIGWAHLDPERAATELRSLLAGSWTDGRVPHVQFHAAGDYFPGPRVWGRERSSTITQPPVWAIAARRVAEIAGDVALVTDLLGVIERSHEFFAAARDPLGWGVVAVAHPWESGMDDAPQWDGPLAHVDAGATRIERVDVGKVDDPRQRPTDDQYRRYIALVTEIRESGFGAGRFAVYDPFITAILALAEADLADLASTIGDGDGHRRARARYHRLVKGLRVRLWDPRTHRFAYHDAITGERQTPDVIGAYGPLVLDDALDDAQRTAMTQSIEQRFMARWPLATVSVDDSGFDRRRYWRGPAWINVNWLLAPHLPGEIVGRSLELLEREGLREYFDPVGGQGLGARDFSWSAALALDWLAQID